MSPQSKLLQSLSKCYNTTSHVRVIGGVILIDLTIEDKEAGVEHRESKHREEAKLWIRCKEDGMKAIRVKRLSSFCRISELL